MIPGGWLLRFRVGREGASGGWMVTLLRCRGLKQMRGVGAHWPCVMVGAHWPCAMAGAGEETSVVLGSGDVDE